MTAWYTKRNIPDTYWMGVADTGYSNETLALDWIRHFDRCSARRQVGAWRVLLLNGPDSDCTREFITSCDEKKIVLFCLPLHSTHLLQPLDVVIFQPYKYFHAQALDTATHTGCSKFNQIEFFSAMESIRAPTFKRSTMLSGFRKTWLIPFNPAIVLDKLPAIPPVILQVEASPTPSPPLESIPSTPKTIRSLKHHANSLRPRSAGL